MEYKNKALMKKQNNKKYYIMMMKGDRTSGECLVRITRKTPANSLYGIN